MEPEPEAPGAAFFLSGAGADPRRSKPELAPGLGHPEPEPPKKVAAPQHWTSANLMWPYLSSLDLSSPFVTSAVLPLVILANLILPQLNSYDLNRHHMTLCDLSRPPVTLAILI